MKEYFNLALIPTLKAAEFVALAQQFEELKECYLLGEYSLPHVTLCHFNEERENIAAVWNRCRGLLKAPLQLTFENFSCTQGKNRFWISLLPKEHDELQLLHRLVLTEIKNPLNKAREHYEPHLSLANTRVNSYENKVAKVAKHFLTLTDNFILALGKADAAWQFTEVLFKAEL